ncbi:MAG: hypothetical protein OXC26_00820 [Albidovulum sp.]|nr:hypothetical protein [Albidovulum sp.]
MVEHSMSTRRAAPTLSPVRRPCTPAGGAEDRLILAIAHDGKQLDEHPTQATDATRIDLDLLTRFSLPTEHRPNGKGA